jgi:hypothetical protein
MSPVDALLLAALLLWCVGLVRAIVHCLYSQTLVPGVARTRGRRWLLWPLVLLAHYLGPRLTLRSRLTAVGQLKRAGIGGAVSAVDWIALRCWSASVPLLLAGVLPNTAIGLRLVAASGAAIAGWYLPLLLLRALVWWRRVTMLRELAGYRDRMAVATECGCALPEALRLAVEWGRQGPMRHYMSGLLLQMHSLASSAALRRHDPPWVPLPVARFASELARACTAMAPAGYAYAALRAATRLSAASPETRLISYNNYLIHEDLPSDDAAGAGYCDGGMQQSIGGAHRRYARAPPL